MKDKILVLAVTYVTQDTAVFSGVLFNVEEQRVGSSQYVEKLVTRETG